MDDLYRYNEDFREYVDKYCAAHKISKDEALTHNIIKAVALVYNTISQKKHEGGYYT